MPSTAPLAPVIAAGPNSLVVVDPSVSGFQALLDALPADAHVLVLNSRSDAIAQITTALHGLGGGASSLHIVSHGGDGVLSLGGQRVDTATIAARAPDLAALGQQLAEGADIVLYGCDVAATATGRSFVDALAAATHADAAASTDRTGDAALGGNWVLEYQHGHLETTAVFNGVALAGSGIVLALPNGRQEITGTTVPLPPDYAAGFQPLNGLPGFTLKASEDIDNTLGPDPLGFFIGQGNAASSWFQFQADGTTLASFDLTELGFVRYNDPNYHYSGAFTFTLTGYKAAGGTVSTTFSIADGSATYSAINYTGFTGLNGFKIDMDRTALGAGNMGTDQHTFDFFTVANAVEPPFAPTLSTISTLAGGTEDTAYTITYAALAAAANEADANSGDTLSFRVETLSSGTLTKGGASVTPGSTLLGPGDSLVWTPSANANGALSAFTVKAWDGALASATAVQVTVTVGAVNDTPTNIALSNASVAENTPTATPLTVGTLSTTDVEAGSFTYSIVGGADAGVFAISGSNLQFKAGTVLDFEAKPSYTVTVRTTDAGGATFDKALTVNLTNVNETPTVATPIPDQAANATHAFTFAFASNAFQDPDAATTLTYTATLGSGGALPGWLSFAPGTRTFSGTPAAGDAGTLQIKVTASDGSLSASDTFALLVTNGPMVSSIVRAAAASATVPTAATSVSYTVTFSESVTGVDAADFTLTATGSAAGTVASVTGSGSTYTVVVNSISGDGNLRLDLNASGTGIQNGSSTPIASGFAAGESFSLDHTEPAAPSAPAMSAGTDTGTPADAITSNTTPTFTGSGEANATVKLYDTNGPTLLGTAVADGSGNWSITSSTLSEGAHSLSARQTDAAGNVSLASSGLAVTIDTTAPTLAITSNVPALKIGETATITFTFSEDPGASFNWNGTVGDVVVTGGTLGAISGSGLTRTATFTPTAATNGGSASITVAAGTYTDTAGNNGGAGLTPTLAFDTQAPTAPLAMVLAAGSDSGTAGDNTTNATTPTITGTAEADSTVTLYDDTNGSTVLGSTTAAVGGAWSIASSTLAQGSHSLTTKATDAAGNTSLASAALVVTIDTTPPAAPSAPALDPASDSGASSTDRTTSVATPTVTGTADAGTTVTLYDSNGTTVLGSTDAAGGAWSITSTALAAGTHTLTTKAFDAAGNPSAASLGLAVTIDTTAPAFASATVNGNTLVLAYTEAGTLDAVHIPATGAFTVMVGATANTVTAVAVDAAAKTVTLTLATAVAHGQAVTVAYADPTAGDDTPAIQDVAGNDAATLPTTAVTNTTPAPDPGPGTPPSSTVDGVPVTTAPGPDGSTVITIPVVLVSRPDNPGTPSSLADIPLVKAPDGHPILEVSVPTGVGLQAQGLPTSTTGAAAQTALGAGIERVNGNNPELNTASQAFLATLAPNEALTVQTLKPTIGAGYNPAVPLVISGSANPADGKQAVILDARSLPSGTIIEVDNIDFIVVVGNVRLVGGAGQNVASGDGSTQWIVLGPDDDIIHGGGGNDVVGSEGGDDQVSGDAGDDIVFGGAGNDILSGGTGSDRLNGGTGFDVALQEGKRTDYTVTLEGAGIKLTHIASGVSDWLVDVEQVRFATGPSLTVAHSAAEEAAAFLFQKWVGRDLTQAEGAAIQTLTGKTALEVATLFAQVFPQQAAGKTPAQLLEGMASAGAIRVDAIRDVAVTGDAGHNTITPTLGLARYVDGGAGIDTVVIPATLAQTHIQSNGSGTFTLQRMTDGAMLDLTSVERITLSDTQLALDLGGHAGEAAKLLGALGGPAILSNKALVGEVIRALDAGVSSQALAGIGLQALGVQTPGQVAQLLWTNVVGRAGTQAELQPLVNLLGQGVTASDLAVMAGHLDLNATRIDLVGLTAKGIEFA